MARISGYLAIYFVAPLSEITEVSSHLLEQLVSMSPPFRRGFVTTNAPTGKLRRFKDSTTLMTMVSEKLERARQRGEDVMLGATTSESGSYVGDYLIDAWIRGITFVREYRTHLPGLIHYYFPDEAAGEALFLRLEDLVREHAPALKLCYGYINPVVMYDDFRIEEENGPVLKMLEENPILDFFADENCLRHYVDKVKGPMWQSFVTRRHLNDGLRRRLEKTCILKHLGDELFSVRLETPYGKDPTFDRIRAYRSLAAELRSIQIADFVPVTFRFPEGFGGGERWLQRFERASDTL